MRHLKNVSKKLAFFLVISNILCNFAKNLKDMNEEWIFQEDGGRRNNTSTNEYIFQEDGICLGRRSKRRSSCDDGEWLFQGA